MTKMFSANSDGLIGVARLVPFTRLGSLRTTSIKKIDLYFTYECRDKLKSFSLFLTVKITSKLNMEHSVKFGI